MGRNTFDNLKIIILVLFTVIVITVFGVLLYITRDSLIVKKIKNFIDNSDASRVLYIYDNDNYNKYVINILNKYEVDYLSVDSAKLSKIEKTKIEKKINSKYLTNNILVINNGKIEDALIECNNQEKINIFFQNNNIIPSQIADVKEIMENIKRYTAEKLSVIYVPYVYSKKVDNQSELLNIISSKYSVSFEILPAYLLSNFQKEKLNSEYKVSSVEDQLILFVKDGKIENIFRGEITKDEIIDNFRNYLLIPELIDNIKNISYDKFAELVKQQEKSVIVIGKNECQYCDDLLNILKVVSKKYDCIINYLNVGEKESDVSIKTMEMLNKMEYKENSDLPITLIIESNKILEFSVGTSDENYFIDIFTENGIIKNEVQE